MKTKPVFPTNKSSLGVDFPALSCIGKHLSASSGLNLSSLLQGSWTEAVERAVSSPEEKADRLMTYVYIFFCQLCHCCSYPFLLFCIDLYSFL